MNSIQVLTKGHRSKRKPFRNSIWWSIHTINLAEKTKLCIFKRALRLLKVDLTRREPADNNMLFLWDWKQMNKIKRRQNSDLFLPSILAQCLFSLKTERDYLWLTHVHFWMKQRSYVWQGLSRQSFFQKQSESIINSHRRLSNVRRFTSVR